ncbi:aldo/keto reductase [Halarchaeum nitratireducens]|uniref:Oxidoreductase n=1 Tax=Halarchaeum nitratireducens TaxID=489913 RepID=A0A830GDV8_9EURY|nr:MULTISPECIES: aldo/keto reductase [Halarchaeum]MBP2251689.1 aryl-alcohol dehydrogenase-like predicted oxidoreductase [Halarchaeum solikamskense]GGN23046.1 oxidoreductase [Halarchaeum nitratireducens]
MVTNESDTFDIGGEYTVHRLGFGAMRITGEDVIGRPESEPNARDVLRRADELGVDFIDTADSYGPAVSERLIGEALDATRDDLVVATKAGLLRNREGEWLAHGGPDYIKNQALTSIDRLGVDSIDLYQFHRPDPDTDYEASIQAFAELQDDGLVDHVGISNVSVEQLELARDHVDVATVQNEYNLGDREHEDVLEACEEYDIGFIPYFPVGAGGFDDEARDAVETVAERHDASVYQVALAWLLDHSDVTLPIPGTSSVSHLEQNVAASELALTDADRATLDVE